MPREAINTIYAPMQTAHCFKTFVLAVVLGLCALTTASAQSLGTDDMPSRSRSQRYIREAEAAPVYNPAAKPAAAPKADVVSAKGEQIVSTAMKYLGARYRSGHSGPSAFDCSGFTSFVYRNANLSITRSSRSQFAEGTPINNIADLKKGDLVFFSGSSRSRNVGHVGIVTEVADDGKSFRFVHAARTGVQVDKSNSAYYSRRYLGARRIVQE